MVGGCNTFCTAASHTAPKDRIAFRGFVNQASPNRMQSKKCVIEEAEEVRALRNLHAGRFDPAKLKEGPIALCDMCIPPRTPTLSADVVVVAFVVIFKANTRRCIRSRGDDSTQVADGERRPPRGT